MCARTIIAILALILPQQATPEHPTVSELLEKHAASRGKLQSFIIKSELLADTTNTAHGGYSTRTRALSESRKDGERRDLTTTQIRLRPSPFAARRTGDEPYTQTSRSIWDGEKYISHVSSLGKTFYIFIWRNERRKDAFFVRAERGNFLHGIFPIDDKPAESILAGASEIGIRAEMEDVGGAKCYVIDAVTPHGKYSVWIDPEHGYNIPKAEVHKGINDICGDKPMGKHKMPRGYPGYKGPMPAPMVEYSYSFDNVRFEKVDGVWVPVEGTRLTTSKHSDGDVGTIKSHYKRTHIDLDPDFEAVGAFVPNIPDGTYITSIDGSGIRRTWRDGRVVDKNGRVIIDLKRKKPARK